MKSVELFAGAGGLGIGLHQAGFSPLNVIEWDRYCCDTLRDNLAREVNSPKDWGVITYCNVRVVDFKRYEGKVHLISGGPPFHPFSLGGKHRTYDDTCDLFPHAIPDVCSAPLSGHAL